MYRKAAVVAHIAHRIICRAVKAVSALTGRHKKRTLHASTDATQVSGHMKPLQGAGHRDCARWLTK